MAIEEFKKKLEDIESEEHRTLLKRVKDLIEMSRSDMSKHYDDWDRHEATFKSERKEDQEDRVAGNKGQPKKMIVPLSFAQVMTFVSFCVSTITQNKRFYELEPTGTEDNPLREPIEVLLERDLRRNQWTAFLVQFFLDIGVRTLGVAEVCWTEEYEHVRVTQKVKREEAFGIESEEEVTKFVKVPKFVGNKVYNISPYRFFPDTRKPLTRYQEGEFCGSEDSFGMSTLRGDDNLFNLDKIRKYTTDDFSKRLRNSRVPQQVTRKDKESEDQFVTEGDVIVTKCVFRMRPTDFEIDGEKVLGDEEFPVRYICWYANDGTIIRFEEAYYLHGMFPYVCAQYQHDQHRLVNESLAGVCEQITDLVTWKLNAHVAAQRNIVDSKFIVDPAGIDMKTLTSRSPWIMVKRNMGNVGLDRYIKQFEVKDTTAGVMSDVAALRDILEYITGQSGNMHGQYAQGRRSATEAKVVASAGSARAKTPLGSIWDTAFEPLGRQLITNNRQGMEFEQFERMLKGVVPADPMTGVADMESLYALFHADPVVIASQEDFLVFDATLPSEKAFLAQSLQEVLLTMLTNPEVGAIMGYGPQQFQQLFTELYSLRGVTNSRLPAPTPQQAPALTPLPSPQPQPQYG